MTQQLKLRIFALGLINGYFLGVGHKDFVGILASDLRRVVYFVVC